jgi:PilZ domain
MGSSPQPLPRGSERRPVKMIAHLFAISDDEVCGAGAYTLDLSETGSRIHTVLDLVPGELIEFHPYGLGNAMLARVVWTERTDAQGRRDVGLQFLGNVPQSSEC